MKGAILLVILYVALLNSVAAQFIFMPKKPVDSFDGLIDKYESCQLKDSIPFSYIHVIDSRYDTTIIGLYINDYLALKDTSQPLALQHTLDKYYHSLYTPGKDTLVIQLEKLFITDRLIEDPDYIVTHGTISCKQFTGHDNSYVYRGNFDTLIKEKYSNRISSVHKNGKHSNYEFWDYYLLRLCEAAIENALQSNNTIDSNQQYYTVENIKKEGLLKRQKPILIADSLKPGFYNSFSEFENNSPGFTYDSASALPKLLDLMHYRVSKKISNEAPDTSYWGFCDGKKLFVRYEYNFYQLDRKDAGFYISSTLDANSRSGKTAGWNTLIGIAVLTLGIATNSGLDFDGFSAIPKPTLPCIVLQINNDHIWGVQLDWNTGNVTY